MDEKRKLAEFAENLWRNFFKTRLNDAMSDKVSYFRGTVVNNPMTTPPSLDIKRPFNDVVRYKCADGMADAQSGDEVTVLRLGNGNKKNEVVVSNGSFTKGFDKSVSVNEIINLVYPVGSLYWSAESTNPEELFEGTTWIPIKDTFVLAAGDTYSAGSTGGEAEHTLSISEMPEHGHKTLYYSTSAGAYNWGYNYTNASGKGKFSVSEEEDNSGIGHNGGGQPHNNMPPYITRYCWQRTN